jgi:hypothetical protein
MKVLHSADYKFLTSEVPSGKVNRISNDDKLKDTRVLEAATHKRAPNLFFTISCTISCYQYPQICLLFTSMNYNLEALSCATHSPIKHKLLANTVTVITATRKKTDPEHVSLEASPNIR